MAINQTRAVSRFSTEQSLVRDVSEDMILREPNANRLFVLTGAAKRKRPSDTPKFEWFEDQEVTFWGQVSNGTTTLSSTATSIPVADVTVFAVGDLVAVPNAPGSASAEEVMLVTAVAGSSSGTLTVTRGIGDTTSQNSIGATASLRIIGSAMAEDDDTPAQRYQAQQNKVSYCQIFRTPVVITHTAASSKKFGGPDRKYQLTKALIRHRSEIEGAGLWSRPSEALSGTSSRWTTMGLKPTISTNKTNANTTLTQTVFNNFCESAFRFGEDQKLFIASPKILSALNFFAQGKLNTYVDDKVYGLSVQRYIAALGEFLLHNNYRLEAGIAGANGFDDEAYSVDLPSVELRYLNGGDSLIGDTKLFQDVERVGTTVRTDEYRSQIGWAIRHESKHALLYNVTAYA
jgi:hypothetical protein